MHDELKNSILTPPKKPTENAIRLKMLFDIGSILASSEALGKAMPQILEVVCRALQFEIGEFWNFERDEEVLRLKTSWHSLFPKAEDYLEESRKFEFARGEGLPGQVWGAIAPVWIENLAEDADFARKVPVARAGLNSAFAFPVSPGKRLLGVFNFFSREIRRADQDLLGMFAAVGNLIGQFIERENAEQKFRESEARYRIVAETASDALLSIDASSTILFANSAVERIFGHRVEEVIGQKLTMLMPEYLRAVHEAGISRYVATGKRHLNWEHIEVPGLHLDGHEFPLELSFGESNLGGRHVFIGIARDITERKKAEQTLLERERLALLNSDVSHALIQNNSLQDILRACTEAVVKHLDAAFARIWTLNEDENVLELQTSSGMYTHLDGEHSRIPVGKFKIGLIAEEHKPHLTNSVVGDARVSEQEWARREAMVAFAGYPLVIEKRLVGVIAMFARKPLTAQTLEALASISNTVALGIERKRAEAERERLLENETMLRREAEVANRAKDEFLAVVSHELRSPLNAMLGWTRILQNSPLDAQTTEHALSVIVRNARSQSKLIEDLLDASRISRGELRFDMQPLELIPVIKSAIEFAAPAASEKEISMSEEFDTSADLIIGDADRLTQILDNLLSNAIKFTPPSGYVKVRLERDGNEAKIIVNDSGQGISREFLPHLFHLFRQADRSDTRRHGGLGIGLSLARHLVELHGGRISVESAGEGEGATFTVFLPLRTVAPLKENPDSNGAESMDNQGKLSGVWVLAVDDEADAREMVSFMLQINGARVTSARSAVEALEILREAGERLPDLLLSDISMPNESGYALLEKIRALPQENGGQIPAIALTAFNRPEDRQAALEAGFQKHLGKPVEPDNLISAIIETATRNSSKFNF